MKRIFSAILILSMLAGMFSLPASAKTVPEVISGVVREQLIFEDMYLLCEVVDDGDAAKMFETVLVVYPDLVAMIKKNMNDGYTAPASDEPDTAGKDNARYVYAVTQLIHSNVFFDDLTKLTDAVQTGDGGKILACVLEIYPDFVSNLKRELNAYPGEDAAPLLLGGAAMNAPDGVTAEDPKEPTVLWVICAGVGGMAAGALTVFVIMKKKKETVSDSQK